MQLRNLIWATSKHDVYLLSNSSVMHWSSLTGNLSEILNFSGHVAPTEVLFQLLDFPWLLFVLAFVMLVLVALLHPCLLSMRTFFFIFDTCNCSLSYAILSCRNTQEIYWKVLCRLKSAHWQSRRISWLQVASKESLLVRLGHMLAAFHVDSCDFSLLRW